MRLLDGGCGPGSITAGLAQAVAPGRVVGIDLRVDDIAVGAALAKARTLGNLSFQAADLYRLPFRDGAFDAAFAHSVLEHLADPLAALREVRRVLAPGGVVGIADPVWHRTLRFPSNALLDTWDELRPRAVEVRGGHPLYVGEQRALLRQAGFSRTVGMAMAAGSVSGQGPAGEIEETRAMARAEAARLEEDFGPVALREGWVSESELGEMAAALREWGEHPDAYLLRPIACALGWV
jgi:SAM-dependent methyltransferase